MTKIQEFILKVQKDICKVKRNAENPHHNSRYADLEGVMDLLNPLFAEANILVDQSPVWMPHGWTLRTTFTMGTEEKTWELPLLGYESKTPMQSLGSAITFARRYTLKGIFKLVDSDDDANAVTPSGVPSKPARKSDVEKMMRAFASLNVTKSEVEAICQADAEAFTLQDLQSLRSVYEAIKTKQKTKEQFIAESGGEQWQA